MISPANLEKVLKTSRKFGVSKICFNAKGEISSIEFERNGATVPDTVTAKPAKPVETKEAPPVEVDLPSDEELRYLSTDFVPAHMAPDADTDPNPEQLAS